MRKWGATRIELGVQAADDKIYKITKRGHKIKDIIQATKALKQAGFKICYHLMYISEFYLKRHIYYNP